MRYIVTSAWVIGLGLWYYRFGEKGWKKSHKTFLQAALALSAFCIIYILLVFNFFPRQH